MYGDDWRWNDGSEVPGASLLLFVAFRIEWVEAASSLHLVGRPLLFDMP